MPKSDVDEERIRNDAAAMIAALTDSMEAFQAEAQMLRHEVRVVEESAARDRKILRWLAAISFLLLPLIVATGLGAWAAARAASDVEQCTTPSGACAQRSAQRSALVVQNITWRTEKERLLSEIAVAERQGISEAVVARKERLAQVQMELERTDSLLSSTPVLDAD